MAETRFSKMQLPEIYAISMADALLPAYRQYAADLKAQQMATTTPPPTTNPLQVMLNDAVKALPAPLQPYGPVIILGAGATLLLLVLGGKK